MKSKTHTTHRLIYLFLCIIACNWTDAQQLDCNFSPPVFTVNFGDGDIAQPLDVSMLNNYKRVRKNCPDDGEFALEANTGGCFGGNWHNLNGDHTGGNSSGKMLLVNAALQPGTFFVTNVPGLKTGTRYEFSVWMVNVCRSTSGCSPTLPVINITVRTNTGVTVGSFRTGAIATTPTPKWRRFVSSFALPAGASEVQIIMQDITEGGCGNDFAMDDMEIRECIIKVPEKIEPPKPAPPPAVVKKELPAPKPVVSVPQPAPAVSRRNNEKIEKDKAVKQPEKKAVEIKSQQVNMPVPDVLLKRANPVVKRIETAETEITIDIYDNGQTDGDTVTIYHNNQLIKSHAGLSEKAVTFKIKVDKNQPHHELVMVADNLGSIPPNTCVMVVTALNKRYEVFISSTEEKNARVIIDLGK